MADGQIEPVFDALPALPDRGDPFADLAEAIREYVAKENTTRAYSADWRTWLEFCEMAQRAGRDARPLDVSSNALLVYARWLAGEATITDGTVRPACAPETIRRRLTGVLAGWRKHGVHYPRGISGEARQFVRRYADALVEAKQKTGRGQAPALSVEDTKRIVQAAPPTLAGKRDLALILLGFSIGARRSELAYLDVDDIAERDRGVEVHIRKSKTGERRVKVRFGQYDSTCPVLAWRRWLEASGITDGAAFRSIDRHDNVGGRLTGDGVSRIVTRAAQRAGVRSKLTGHSLRAGMATEARRAGHRIDVIAKRGGWQENSPALLGYIREVDDWGDEENAMAGVGL